ncbi:hypothetical protein N9L62_02010 [Candidatus Actinomarina sp.]|nr:hypothetical protein [Candidatus Actinomarina sp.]
MNDAFGKQLSSLCNVQNLNDDLEVLDTLEIPCPTDGCYDRLPIIKSVEFKNLNFKFGDEPIFEVMFDNSINYVMPCGGYKLYMSVMNVLIIQMMDQKIQLMALALAVKKLIINFMFV